MQISTQWKSIASTDIEQVQSSVSSLITSHRLSLKKGLRQPLNTRLKHAKLGQISLMRLGYGADVCIQPEQLAGFYLLQVPQYGGAVVRCGSEKVESSPKVATVLNPNTEIDMIWLANNEQLMLKIDRLLIERLAKSMHLPVPESGLLFPVRFEGHCTTNWQLMQRYLIDCARHADEVSQSPLLVSQLEQLVATTFLETHKPISIFNTSTSFTKVLPKNIQLVKGYLYDCADQAIRVDELAALAGVSIRSLQLGFKEHFGMSPMQYLRQIRLDKARADLLDTSGKTPSVTEVALRWGFHQGRFSALYRQRFGETPSQTLGRLYGS